MITNSIKQNYIQFKEKKGDDLLIKIGIVGVVAGLLLSISFLNQFFAWFILLGFGIKLYDFAEKEQQRFEPNDEDKITLVEEVANKFRRFKEDGGDLVLIIFGILGVIIGWITTVTFIQHLAAWFILIGIAIKLFDNDSTTSQGNTVK